LDYQNLKSVSATFIFNRLNVRKWKLYCIKLDHCHTLYCNVMTWY